MAAMAQYYTVARERHNIHIVFHPIEVHQLLYVCVCVCLWGGCLYFAKNWMKGEYCIMDGSPTVQTTLKI